MRIPRRRFLHLASGAAGRIADRKGANLSVPTYHNDRARDALGAGT
jgi:hypothetical protein